MAEKSEKAEVERRITVVYMMIIKGASSAEIVQHAAQTWEIEARQAREYIRRANNELSRQAKIKRDVELGKALERMTSLYSSSLKLQDYRTCLSVQKEINTLLGLYAPTKVQVDDWRSEAIEYIRRGELSFEALADEFDPDLATELFRAAGVPVTPGAGATKDHE